jgi:hypothetical protein
MYAGVFIPHPKQRPAAAITQPSRSSSSAAYKAALTGTEKNSDFERQLAWLKASAKQVLCGACLACQCIV